MDVEAEALGELLKTVSQIVSRDGSELGDDKNNNLNQKLTFCAGKWGKR